METASILDSLRIIKVPMRTKFRGIDSREIALIKGPYGWGEFSPFLEYDERESAPWLRSAIEAAFEEPPALYRRKIEINGTIPALDDVAKIEEIISWYPGAKVFKIKVGDDRVRDIARIKSVRSLVPDARIRIDVNGNWSVPDAVDMVIEIHRTLGQSLEYVEQPVSTLNQLRELRSKLPSDIKIAGDEVLRKSRDPFAIELDGAVDFLILKVAPLGGIKRSLELAEHHGLPVVASSALESAVGIMHGLRLAAALPKLELASGLATGVLLKEDLARLPIVDGEMDVSHLFIDEGRIEELAAPEERIEWWRNRVTDCWEAAD